MRNFRSVFVDLVVGRSEIAARDDVYRDYPDPFARRFFSEVEERRFNAEVEVFVVRFPFFGRIALLQVERFALRYFYGIVVFWDDFRNFYVVEIRFARADFCDRRDRRRCRVGGDFCGERNFPPVGLPRHEFGFFYFVFSAREHIDNADSRACVFCGFDIVGFYECRNFQGVVGRKTSLARKFAFFNRLFCVEAQGHFVRIGAYFIAHHPQRAFTAVRAFCRDADGGFIRFVPICPKVFRAVFGVEIFGCRRLYIKIGNFESVGVFVVDPEICRLFRRAVGGDYEKCFFRKSFRLRRDCEEQLFAVFANYPYGGGLFADESELFCGNADRLGFEVGVGLVFDFDLNALCGGCAVVEVKRVVPRAGVCGLRECRKGNQYGEKSHTEIMAAVLAQCNPEMDKFCNLFILRKFRAQKNSERQPFGVLRKSCTTLIS